MHKLYGRVIPGLIMLVTLITASCNAERVSETQLRLERYAAKITDMPSGWIFSGEDWSTQFGGESYVRGYVASYSNVIRFDHHIAIYPDEATAKTVYPQWEDEWFKAMEKWPNAEFVPSDPNDEYRFECRQDFPQVVACSYLQQHNQFIVFILVNLDGKAMTFAQMNQILGVLDKRLNTTSVGK